MIVVHQSIDSLQYKLSILCSTAYNSLFNGIYKRKNILHFYPLDNKTCTSLSDGKCKYITFALDKKQSLVCLV